MNKLIRRVTAVCLSAAVCLGGASAAFAQTTDSQQQKQTQSTEAEQMQDVSQDASKDETVYVLAGADGSVQKIIVSDWIKNVIGSGTVADRSELNNIENVKGEESYTMSGDDMKVWDAQNNDIYYQGDIEKELPVNMTVTYKLDGKKVSPEEVAGKSGRITIRFDYQNNQYEMVELNGKEEKIYVPFAMLTGMMLDSDVFHNVKVNNGKLINDGDHTIVAGLAFPGLQEDLALERDKLEIPEYVEITADVTNFKLGMTVTVATNELFNELNTDKLDSIDITDSLGELTDAMTQLMDGSSALYDGLCTLLDKSNELVSGIDQLAEGAKALREGADTLSDGAAQLQSGAAELSAGLDTLSDNSAGLNSGAAQVFNTLLSTATTQIRAAGISVSDLTIGNYSAVLTGIIASLDSNAVYNQALQQVTAAVEAKRTEIAEKVTAAVHEQVTQQVMASIKSQVSDSVNTAVQEQIAAQVIEAATGMSKEEYDAAVVAGTVSEEQQAELEANIAQQTASETVQAQITAGINEQMESAEIQAAITSNIEAQLQSDNVQSTIDQSIEAQIQQAISENMASDDVQSRLSAASEGAKTIIALKTSLDSYHSFYLGLRAYTNGVDSAASGADSLYSGAGTLKDGTAQLKAGAASLYSGVLTLQDGMPALISGITQLRDGSMELSDGLRQLNEQGIQKLMDFVDDDLDGIVCRLKATIAVSRNYQNFAGISDDMDGQVKFIYRTDEIKVD